MNRLRLICAAACAAFTGPVAAEQVKPLFSHALPNAAGKTLTAVEVAFAPGAKADPHRHGQAFVYAYVLSGVIKSQLAGEPARVFHAGQSWFEPPGADHLVTQNLSLSAPARLLVVFVAEAGATLKIPDREPAHQKDPPP